MSNSRPDLGAALLELEVPPTGKTETATLTRVQLLRAAWLLATTTARARLTYRGATFVGLVSTALGLAIFLLVWLAVYRDNPHGRAVSAAELFPYLTVALSFNATLTLSVESRFALRLRHGQVANDLLRPLGFLPFQMAQAAGDLMANLIFGAPIYALAFAVLGLRVVPPSVLSFGLGVVSLGLAFLIAFGLSYLVLQMAFVTHSTYGMNNARLALHQTFSGLSAPIPLFPPALRSVATCLPFQHVIETPVRIWLGRVSAAEAGALLGRQLVWGLVILALGSAFFRGAVRRHQIQAG